MNKRQKEVSASQLADERKVLYQLRKEYSEALKDINGKISDFQTEISALQMAVQQETDENQKAALQSQIQAKVYQRDYQKAMKSQVGTIIDQLNSNQYDTIKEYLNGCYESGYLGTMYDLQGQGIPITVPIDQTQVVQAIVQDTKLSKPLYEALGYHLGTLKKQVNSEISRGIAGGLSYADIARNIEKRSNVSLNKAYRIARTEGHRITQTATYNAQVKAKESGADVVKQWDATMDGRTRSDHRQLDGQIREINEPFEVGGMKAMFPGDFGIASEDCNCRCVVLQRAKWALDEEELQTLKDRAAYFGLDKTEDFEDYKRKYLASSGDAEYNIFNNNSFIPAKTIDEAEEFIKRFVDDTGFANLGVSYKGISISSANEVNNALSKLYDSYNIEKLGGVFVAKGNTKLGQTVTDAVAAYSPIRKSLILNNRELNNIGDFLKSKSEELRFIEMYRSNPSSVVFKTRRAEEVTKSSLLSGRATVPESIEDVINHEMGHALEKTVKSANNFDTIKANMSKYAEKISGYATYDISEYIAESFASYRKGENLIDPDLNDLFERLKKNKTSIQIGASNTSKHSLENIGNSSIVVTDRQFGKKVGKHAVDFNLNPQIEEDRIKFKNITEDIIQNRDEVFEGEWRSQSGKVLFYVKGEDVVIVNKNNEYVTTLKGGINNARIKDARNK